MTDFSQSGEQEMILKWADRHGPGRFLDIGAADGITASNTRALALAGWDGVCVEPAAAMFDKLLEVYTDRPDVQCVQAALVPDDYVGALVPFHYSRDLVSTTEPANAATWAELVRFVRCHVAAVKVAELLRCFGGPFDLVSIDTEGTSVELWECLRQHDVFAPGTLVIVEAENGGERWLIQRACLEGWARIGVTPNNVILERL